MVTPSHEPSARLVNAESRQEEGESASCCRQTGVPRQEGRQGVPVSRLLPAIPATSSHGGPRRRVKRLVYLGGMEPEGPVTAACGVPRSTEMQHLLDGHAEDLLFKEPPGPADGEDH